MVGTVQAEPYYGIMDKTYKKSSGKDVSVKSIKCNNVNVNVNGLEIDGLPPSLSTLITGGEADYNASSYGSSERSYDSGGQSGYDNKNSFRFVCINNNNNTVVGGGGEEEEEIPIPPVDECPEADEIESCFRQFLLDGLFPNFVDALESEAGITVEINGEEATLRSFADICSALEGLTFAQLNDAILEIFAEAGIPLPLPDDYIDLWICIAEAIGIPVPS